MQIYKLHSQLTQKERKIILANRKKYFNKNLICGVKFHKKVYICGVKFHKKYSCDRSHL